MGRDVICGLRNPEVLAEGEQNVVGWRLMRAQNPRGSADRMVSLYL
jgi:hypothetical protein